MEKSKKRQLIYGFFMAASGILAGALGEKISMPLPIEIPVPSEVTVIPATPSDAEEIPATPSDARKTDEEALQEEPKHRLSPASLNLAFSIAEEKEGGMKNAAQGILEALSTKDSQWFYNLYRLLDVTPEQVAAMLGKGPESVLGSYNPEDELHVKEDPATWKINGWENVTVTASDGDGNPVEPYSNVKEVMSLASVYCYYNGAENETLFRQYADVLWEKSHGYTLEMSDIYYCDGCQEIEDGSELEATGDEEPEKADGEIPEEILAVEGPGRDVLIEQYRESGVAQETVGEQDDEVSQDNGGLQDNSGSLDNTVSQDNETVQEEGQEVEQDEPKELFCPGHVDLKVQLVIKGLTEEQGLFSIDPEDMLNGGQNDALPEAKAVWTGWDPYNRAYASYINAQDWETEYGLNVGREVAIGIPLSEAEIRIYMSMLPKDTDEMRKKIVRTALGSVGRIPYYWGGKPSNTGYEGNRFGLSVAADVDGRQLKGLDCSGWINWVYWTATGSPLAAESTSGLAAAGTEISSQDLKPGDIMVRLGAEAHVVMFLAWDEEGKMIVIHESSDTQGGNVMISSKNPDWPYFRNLLD